MSSTVSIKIIGDASNFKKSTKEAQRSLGGLSKTIKTIGGAFAAKQIFDVGKASVTAAADDKKAQALLANALRNATGARDSDIASVEDWISKTSLAKAVADDELRPALATLAKATGDTAKAQDLLSLALDVASSSGKPLETVTKDLAKAQLGGTAIFKKYGVATKDASGNARSLADMQAELAKKTAGAADTAANADGGMKKLGIQFEEIQESLGSLLLPIVKKVAGWLLKLATWFQNNAETVKTLGLVLAPIVGALAALMIVQKVSAAFAVLNAVIAANPIVAIGIAIAALIAGLVLAYQKVEWFRNAVDAALGFVKAIFQGFVDGVRALWERWGDGIKRIANIVFNGIKQVVRGALNVIKGIIKTVTSIIRGDWRGAWNGIKQIFTGIWQGIKGYLGTAMRALKELIRAPMMWIKERVLSVWRGILGFFRAIPGKIGSAFRTLGDTILAPFKMAFNAIANLWNSTVGKLSFEVPSWVPGIGGKGFDVPDIPTFHSGGVFRSARAGGEGLALLRDGERVLTPGAPRSRSTSTLNVTVNVAGSVTSERDLVRSIKDQLISQQRRGFATA